MIFATALESGPAGFLAFPTASRHPRVAKAGTAKATVDRDFWLVILPWVRVLVLVLLEHSLINREQFVPFYFSSLFLPQRPVESETEQFVLNLIGRAIVHENLKLGADNWPWIQQSAACDIRLL